MCRRQKNKTIPSKYSDILEVVAFLSFELDSPPGWDFTLMLTITLSSRDQVDHYYDLPSPLLTCTTVEDGKAAMKIKKT